MDARIELLPRKELVGKSIRMSLIDNKTRELWHSFMSEKSAIKNFVGSDLYSIQVYNSVDYFRKFSPQTLFTKWAAIEVKDFINIPIGFNMITLESGIYAVFIHKGAASAFPQTAQFIFGEWLPKSEFVLDDRPHFELLGKKYKNDDPISEEEVWIPIKKKE